MFQNLLTIIWSRFFISFTCCQNWWEILQRLYALRFRIQIFSAKAVSTVHFFFIILSKIFLDTSVDFLRGNSSRSTTGCTIFCLMLILRQNLDLPLDYKPSATILCRTKTTTIFWILPLFSTISISVLFYYQPKGKFDI